MIAVIVVVIILFDRSVIGDEGCLQALEDLARGTYVDPTTVTRTELPKLNHGMLYGTAYDSIRGGGRPLEGTS